MPAQVTSPQIEIQDISAGWMGLQIRNYTRRIGFLDGSADFRFPWPVIRHRADEQAENHSIDTGRFKFRPVRWKEVKPFGEYRGGNDSQQYQEANVSETAVE